MKFLTFLFVGGTLHLSGVDIIDGTPVLDIKPYVPAYDNPENVLNPEKNKSRYESLKDETTMTNDVALSERTDLDCTTEANCSGEKDDCKLSSSSTEDEIARTNNKPGSNVASSCASSENNGGRPEMDTGQNVLSSSEGSNSSQQSGTSHQSLLAEEVKDRSAVDEVKVADWIQNPPICSKLKVTFTDRAERQLSVFRPVSNEGKRSRPLSVEKARVSHLSCPVRTVACG